MKKSRPIDFMERYIPGEIDSSKPFEIGRCIPIKTEKKQEKYCRK